MGESAMPITIEAVYENGILRPLGPLALPEHQTVRITIEPATNWVQETYGILGWKGRPEDLRELALHPDLDLEEEP
jgi:predicted DNA-binding antitoxin AbrB/MazE fold protein